MSNQEIRVTAVPRARGTRTSMVFSNTDNPETEFQIPAEPGVYRVYRKQDCRTFYVGESRNLATRLTMLFRCLNSSNPHPCHTDYKIAYGSEPQCDKFCEEFGAILTITTGMTGRIEIEEEKQARYKCNRADYYSSWLCDEHDPPAQDDEHRVALAEHIRESHKLALEKLSALPAGDARLQYDPCRVYCGTERGIQYYYYINQRSVKAGAFFPHDYINLYEELPRENNHPLHTFGPGITGNGEREGETRTISITIPGGVDSPRSDWDELAEHAVEGMENIYRLLKPLRG